LVGPAKGEFDVSSGYQVAVFRFYNEAISRYKINASLKGMATQVKFILLCRVEIPVELYVLM
jgi:hypothetical protein